MKKEIIVNSSPNEVRVALLEDGEVVEFSMERAESRRAVGNVYKGVVTAVRPGLQAAFVEIGMEKAGFLHVSDLIHDEPEDDDDGGGRGGRRRRRGRREGLRPIETMLKEGDEITIDGTNGQVLAGSVEAGMITYVTRSRLMGFPDYTTIRAAGPQGIQRQPVAADRRRPNRSC